MEISMPGFESDFPAEHTCDGSDVSPRVEVTGVPVEAESLAFVLEDPDASTDGAFVHWLLWNVPQETTEIPEDVPNEETVESLDGAAQGTNDFGEIGYTGPCPPTEDGSHNYELTVHALDGTLSVEPGADASTVEDALAEHRIDEATVVAEYSR